jgi:hypothetical protein
MRHPRPLPVALLIALAILVGACASSSSSPSGGGPSPAPSATGPASVPALQLDVLRAVGGKLAYCDPDQFPVAHGSQLESAEARYPAIRAQAQVYAAILAYLNLPAGASLSPAQLIAVNEAYKQLSAIRLNPTDDGDAFTVLVPAAGDPAGNQEVRGVVSRNGQVRIVSRGPGHRINCPICLAWGTPIDTPAGPVEVQALEPGMPVWTLDRAGRRVRVVVLEVGSSTAPIGHEVVHLVLADGREVTVSPGHPTIDGRTVGQLGPGDRYAGSVVVSARLVPYTGPRTFDLLPSGPTGIYLAGGVPLASTLTG